MARAEAVMQGGGMIFDFLARADDEFGGGRGRGRAQIGDEIDDGEIGFMAHGGDDGNGLMRQRRELSPHR